MSAPTMTAAPKTTGDVLTRDANPPVISTPTYSRPCQEIVYTLMTRPLSSTGAWVCNSVLTVVEKVINKKPITNSSPTESHRIRESENTAKATANPQPAANTMRPLCSGFLRKSSVIAPTKEPKP